ncbi:MmgE/PrpD [Rubrobacter xylanophilus DSM 9941]|uniref:MmgE/PrpD n=1 Tax=Rubrobacter xylanophilus (strain DSM 9941 / JCM 11954 / NBRC 16129 / PRD-1) TaxID=266117 RepID=Q1ASH7_RUBXD|nr:MmgE/PrpD family protein [Rubrobacter xylanophilus]ABG05651.1 MmgE/PrpD [Rubrobacter xylanophilus DSM 9941]
MKRRWRLEELAAFLAELRYEDLPQETVSRTEELFLDWAGSALAGGRERPVRVIERVARKLGAREGSCEVLAFGWRTSPLFAALVNAASSHAVEQDDVHNGAVLHPGAVVFPAALAAAQEAGASGRELVTAAVAGYEAGVRVGEFLGRSHYRVFHTTGTAGTLAAAAATAHVLGADEEEMVDALGSAGTQAAGLWQFLAEGADSKQLHAAKAASDGLLSAYLAREGLRGARGILEGEKGMAAGMSEDAEPERLVAGLGERWAVLETSFKVHASCRHSHPAADALIAGMRENGLAAEDVEVVRARVHAGALEVLGDVAEPESVHQAKFSMGFVLALVAIRGRAGIEDFSEETLRDGKIRAFARKVEMVLDPEVDGAYPERWIGLVDIRTKDGRTITSRVDVPRGDPGNAPDRGEIEKKVRRLATYGGAPPGNVERIIRRAWGLREEPEVGPLLAERAGEVRP